MKSLTVEVLAGPEALAEWCRRHSLTEWGARGCCPFPATACPLHPIPECRDVVPEHWREVLADAPNPKEKPEPRFRFGDKVTADGRRAVFVNYHAPASAAAILYEGNHVTDSIFVSDIKAGWK